MSNILHMLQDYASKADCRQSTLTEIQTGIAASGLQISSPDLLVKVLDHARTNA